MLERLRFGSGTASVQERQQRWVRAFCVVTVVALIPFGIGLYRQSEWATNLWPLPDVRMTYIFFASIIAAVGAPLAWAAWRNELGVLRAIGFELMLGIPVAALYLLWLAWDRRDRDLVIAGVLFLAFGATWTAIGWWARQVPIRDPHPLPALIRASFVGFCCILIPVGVALTLRIDHVFPWKPSPENATVIGLIFLTAASFFAWIVVHPKWAYGEMALTSFLAYDLVLVVPYLDFMRNRDDPAVVTSYYGSPSYAVVSPDNDVNALSLSIYLTVLAVSAGVAIGTYVWGYMARPIGRSTEGA